MLRPKNGSYGINESDLMSINIKAWICQICLNSLISKINESTQPTRVNAK